MCVDGDKEYEIYKWYVTQSSTKCDLSVFQFDFLNETIILCLYVLYTEETRQKGGKSEWSKMLFSFSSFYINYSMLNPHFELNFKLPLLSSYKCLKIHVHPCAKLFSPGEKRCSMLSRGREHDIKYKRVRNLCGTGFSAHCPI